MESILVSYTDGVLNIDAGRNERERKAESVWESKRERERKPDTGTAFFCLDYTPAFF